ncbi:MAG TPA: heavy metal-binding domain-containing protein [Blastocatellia bacterium]|nr:heavy metal-binding domain-containing protein [Blastocatellia bacterium]
MTNIRRSFLAGALAFAALCLSSLAFAQDPAKQEIGPEPIVYVCPIHPDVNSKLPGTCHKCNMKLVASKGAADGDFHICPMHPDVVSNQPGTCPKCNMKLVKTAPPETSDYVVRIKTIPAPPKPGQKVKLQFTIFHPVNGKQIKDFNILHDMPFHLFVVSQDFESFQHIHPDKQPDGSFTIETDLPKAGYYKIFCDFFPGGGMPQVTHHNLVTAGYNGDLISSQARLTPDTSINQKLVKTVEGTRFELKLEPGELFAGKPAELRYHLVDEKTGEAVKDLKPYLGAWGHTLILSEDATDYLHSHPSEMIPEDVDRSKLESKSDVTFDTFFPRPGNYRIWSQFQRGGKIITVSFTVYVPRLK